MRQIAEVDEAIANGFDLAKDVPGFLGDNELRFLGALAALTPAIGAMVEIGSFKGKSTVMLASVAARFGLGRVVAIDPHAGLGYLGTQNEYLAPTYEEFLSALKTAGVEEHVEAHRAFSREVAMKWQRPIRLLWIDGDHTYRGCKEDFDLFSRSLAAGAVVALHDSLNTFEGPIRVFVEEVLRSDRFGPCGFVHSIAWGQFRPVDGERYREERRRLEKRAARLIPFVENGEPKGLRKIAYKLNRSRVPRMLPGTEELGKRLRLI